MNEETREIIRWLNSPASDHWRAEHICPVDHTVPFINPDGTDAISYNRDVAFASLKWDDAALWSGGAFLCSDENYWESQRYLALREQQYGPSDVYVRSEHALWDGYRWDPDQDPTRV